MGQKNILPSKKKYIYIYMHIHTRALSSRIAAYCLSLFKKTISEASREE